MFSDLLLFHNENCSHCKAQEKFQVIYWKLQVPFVKLAWPGRVTCLGLQHLEHSQMPEIYSIVITEQNYN